MIPSEADSDLEQCFSLDTLDKLVKACVHFYRGSLEKATHGEVLERRVNLSKWVHKFHEDCGTLTPLVKDAIERLKVEPCIFLMTAHQPNLFAYSGVLRKAVLNHVLAKRLSEAVNLPVVSFFGVADQDFTDDRWVRSALLPDAERRDGALELRADLPDKMMTCRVNKPSKQVLADWLGQIEEWLGRKLRAVERSCKCLGLEFPSSRLKVKENLRFFWDVVEEAYARADVYSDFNAFVMSRIVNAVWGIDTLFARFSECQQIFEKQFCVLLSRFDEYSKYVREATMIGECAGGVCEREHETLPFWYHCDCGGKTRLNAERHGNSLVGHGKCLGCGKDYQISFCPPNELDLPGGMERISARSLSMPLVFFDGLKVCCYVGGVGGKDYLRQAQYVAKRMGLTFGPVAVWRPRDVYLGIGQLDALMTYQSVSGTFDFSRFPQVEEDLRGKIDSVQRDLERLEMQKKELAKSGKSEEVIQELKALSSEQAEIRRKMNFPVLVRDLKLLENVKTVMHMYPSIVDFAVNVGLKETGEQWISFLEANGSLSSDLSLRTDFDGLVSTVKLQ